MGSRFTKRRPVKESKRTPFAVSQGVLYVWADACGAPPLAMLEGGVPSHVLDGEGRVRLAVADALGWHRRNDGVTHGVGSPEVAEALARALKMHENGDGVRVKR